MATTRAELPANRMPNARMPNARMPSALSARPTGWFQIGWSSTVPKRGVTKLHYFGQELVAWRSADGAVHVMDAYCQHLGAHLGHGGTVIESGLQCPFHGWVWDGEGHNVSIPYQDRSNTARRIRSWPVIERDEVLYLWHDIAGCAPYFDIPKLDQVAAEIAGIEFEPALPDGASFFAGTNVHPQYVVENAVDRHHFRFVHGTAVSPTILVEEMTDDTWFSVAGFGRRWADGIDRPGDRKNTITIRWTGIGFAHNAEQTPDGWRIVLISTTPVDEYASDMFGTYWLEKREGTTPDERALRLAAITQALPQDIEIWNHQIYLEPPGLASEEAAAFRRLRRWTQKFYPET